MDVHSISQEVSMNVPSCPPAKPHLPAELLQQVYRYLPPRDFNAARHISRFWMLASLDNTLLRCMLMRGGWWSGAYPYMWSHGSTVSSEAWLLSRHLSRQCALSSRWTGNGLRKRHPDRRSALTESCRVDFRDLPSGYVRTDKKRTNGLIFTFSVCEKYLLVAESGMIYIYTLEGGAIRPFTSVICPRRVLAMSMDASAHRYAVAALLEGRMGVVCDLAARSTTCATAGGIGELSCGSQKTSQSSVFTGRVYSFENRSVTDEDAAGHIVPTFDAINIRSANLDATLHGTNDPNRHHGNMITQTWGVHLDASLSPAYGVRQQHTGQAMPIENGPRTIHRHLCSDDDPPRSVAICPQRRCVAFGCTTGIELYWVDAQTQQDLHRWFPVTSPSDYLYFLNPRPGMTALQCSSPQMFISVHIDPGKTDVDSAHKLRIISSIAQPSDRAAINHHFSPYLYDTSTIWAYRNASYASWHRNTSSDLNHYRAVPLSDGYHHLFTDPGNLLLHLGSDAPLGGSIRLIRKILFVPPTPNMVPSSYAVSSNLEQGARVAACYRSPLQDQETRAHIEADTCATASQGRSGGVHDQAECNNIVVLYSVPPDVLLSSRTSQSVANMNQRNGYCSACSSSSYDCANTTCHCANPLSEDTNSALWLEWWPDDEEAHSPPDIDPKLPQNRGVHWPLRLHGTVIGEIGTECAAVAVNETPELTVWAVGRDGIASAWTVDGNSRKWRVERRFVSRDGSVLDSSDHDDIDGCEGLKTGDWMAWNGDRWPVLVDEDGDIVMLDPSASEL